jgi:CHAD domain-containing protein
MRSPSLWCVSRVSASTQWWMPASPPSPILVPVPRARSAVSAPKRAAPRPGTATVRTVARARLEQLLEKVAPLLVVVDDNPARALISEDVHDFRVAVRRLRSWLRACKPLLGDDVPRALRNALRKLARRAGRARDAQVQWQWLRALPVPHTAGASRAAAWHATVRANDFGRDYTRLRKLVTARWPALAAALASALGEALRDRATPRGEAEVALRAHLGAVITHHAVAAQRALARVEHSTQVKEIHRARIQLKRLRYAVEAVPEPGRPARTALKRLRQLQDSLGEIHDAHVLSAAVDDILGRPPRRGTARPALRDLRGLHAALRRAERAAFRGSLDQLAAPLTTAMWTTVDALATRLTARIA